MKLYFHPGTDMAQAMAETVGYVNRSRLHAAGHRAAVHHAVRHRQRAGRLPRAFRARRGRSTRSRTWPLQGAADVRQPARRVRPRRRSAATSGPSSSASIPSGFERQELSPDEVIEAVGRRQHVARPATSASATAAAIVPTNAMVGREPVANSAKIPVKTRRPSRLLRDVATIEDATDIPTGYALVNGRRAVYILVTKRADASTLGVVNEFEGSLPRMPGRCPTTFTSTSSSTSRLRHRIDVGRGHRKGSSGRC